MLHRLTDLRSCRSEATDGPIGRIDDVLFDDRQWTIRYFMIATGTWLRNRRVLLSPISVAVVDAARRQIHIDLDRRRVRGSPEIDTDSPVSHQKGIAFHHDGKPVDWQADDCRRLAGQEAESRDPHLRCAGRILGYHIAASDGLIGHVDDFLADGESWRIWRLVVDTGNSPGGRRVLLSPTHVRAIDWSASLVQVDVTRDRVHNSREFHPSELSSGFAEHCERAGSGSGRNA
jgi:hypothetical protein